MADGVLNRNVHIRLRILHGYAYVAFLAFLPVCESYAATTSTRTAFVALWESSLWEYSCLHTTVDVWELLCPRRSPSLRSLEFSLPHLTCGAILRRSLTTSSVPYPASTASLPLASLYLGALFIFGVVGGAGHRRAIAYFCPPRLLLYCSHCRSWPDENPHIHVCFFLRSFSCDRYAPVNGTNIVL